MERIFAKEFLLDSYKFVTSALVLSIVPCPPLFKVKLSNTVFHPQGGGQPNDRGRIFDGRAEFKVESAENDKIDNNVWHFGNFVNEVTFHEGCQVQVEIDEAFRRVNARIHSGGHLLDIAVQRLGFPLVPGKGYHFEEGSYVEYSGNIQDRDAAIVALNTECQKIIEEAQENVLANIISIEEAEKLFEVPQFLKNEPSVRFVKLTNQDKGCPCGGTHVKSVKEIGKIIVTKMQKKGKNLRVSYRVE
jgi:Ser-tRNA(Ala) deacylase AlaX